MKIKVKIRTNWKLFGLQPRFVLFQTRLCIILNPFYQCWKPRIGNLNNELKRQYPSYQRGAHSSSAVLMSGSAAIYFAATVIRLTVLYVVTVSYLWLLITDPTMECNNKGVITVITPLCCCVRVHQCQPCSVGLVQQPTTSLVCCVKCVGRFSSWVL